MKRLLVALTFAAVMLTAVQESSAEILQVLGSIDLPTPSGAVKDIAWDGQDLVVSIQRAGGITFYWINPSDGTVSSSRAMGALNLHGIAWDGTQLWNTNFQYLFGHGDYGTSPDTLKDYIAKRSADGTLLAQYEAPGSRDVVNAGLAWDGAYLWVSDLKHRTISQVNPADMSVVTSFASPGTGPLGLEWDGSSLWCVDGQQIYNLDTSGNVLGTFAAPGSSPFGIAFDGSSLWISDAADYRLYEVAVTIPEPSAIALWSVGLACCSVMAWRRRKRNPVGQASCV
jgi:hypothetical protein